MMQGGAVAGALRTPGKRYIWRELGANGRGMAWALVFACVVEKMPKGVCQSPRSTVSHRVPFTAPSATNLRTKHVLIIKLFYSDGREIMR
jgi:hypothetical protein